MNPFIENIVDQWAACMWPAIWQSTLLAAVIYLATFSLRKKAAAVRFWLWMLVPLRLLVMPLVTIGVPVLPPSTDSAIIDNGSPSAWLVSTDSLTPESAGQVNSSPDFEAENNMRSATSADAHISIWAILMTGWLAGVGINLTRLITGWRRMRRIIAGAVEVTDDSLAAASLRLRYVPRILVTEKKISPFAFGIVHPCVILPKELMNKGRAEALSAVVAHESAHLRRRDPLIGWILAICEMFYFFHPILYFVKRRILVEREKACDECVVAVDRSRRSIYANALVDAADICHSFTARVRPVSLVAESFSDLKKRLIAIGTNTDPKVGLSAKTLILLILIGIICMPGLAIRASEGSGRADTGQLITRVYDVTMLVYCPAGPDGSGRMMDGLPGGYGSIDPNLKDRSKAEPAVTERLGELVNTIKETIEPNSWSHAGGAGAIEVHENHKLIILQTLKVHEKIEIVLDDMQKAKSRMVQIDARFITVTEDFLNEVGADVNSMRKYAQKQQKMSMEKGKVEFQRKHFEPGIADSLISTSSSGYSIIQDDFSKNLLLKAVQAHMNCKALVTPRITLLDGERATLMINEEIPYISGFAEPNESSEQPQPMYDYMDIGKRMEVLPKLTSQGDILLNLDLSFSILVGYEKRLYEDGNEYDVPKAEIVSLSTQVMVPDGGTLLIGGGRCNIETEDGQIAERDLLILIKPEKTEPDTGNDNSASELPAMIRRTDNRGLADN